MILCGIPGHMPVLSSSSATLRPVWPPLQSVQRLVNPVETPLANPAANLVIGCRESRLGLPDHLHKPLPHFPERRDKPPLKVRADEDLIRH